MRNYSYHSRRKQQGAVLLVSLVLLIVLTLYGLSTSNLSILQSKMTTSNSDNNRALTLAESAVHRAIADIEAFENELEMPNIYSLSDPRFDVGNKSLWFNGNPNIKVLGNEVDSVESQVGAYFIVYNGVIDGGDGSSLGSPGDEKLLRSPQFGDRPMAGDSGAGGAGTGGAGTGGAAFVERLVMFRIVGMGTNSDGSGMRIIEAFYQRPLDVLPEEEG
ncbi:MAG: PilX N-terminal domain-containing pilus assembly protein [Cellvibrionales bacterium]|nr:PilX N-terminal domain-containing pilus assembly protein [Cellvibrionales bacterium]